MEQTGANVSVIFVPPRFAKAAVVETIDAGVPLCVVITEGIPVHDTAWFFQYAQDAGTTRLVGPNCPGLITPGQSNAGIIPADITQPGRIGLVSKSGTLTYQMMYELRDIGFSTAVGIGGDPVIGTTHIDCLAAFEADPDTDAIVMIGEIGGDAEERAADYIKANVTKPVVGYVAGFTAPEGKTMGHAGAIVSGSSGTAVAKQEALEAAGVRVGKTPSETARIMRELMTVRLTQPVTVVIGPAAMRGEVEREQERAAGERSVQLVVDGHQRRRRAGPHEADHDPPGRRRSPLARDRHEPRAVAELERVDHLDRDVGRHVRAALAGRHAVAHRGHRRLGARLVRERRHDLGRRRPVARVGGRVR